MLPTFSRTCLIYTLMMLGILAWKRGSEDIEHRIETFISMMAVAFFPQFKVNWAWPLLSLSSLYDKNCPHFILILFYSWLIIKFCHRINQILAPDMLMKSSPNKLVFQVYFYVFDSKIPFWHQMLKGDSIFLLTSFI